MELRLLACELRLSIGMERNVRDVITFQAAGAGS